MEDLSLPPEERRSEDAFTGGLGEAGGEYPKLPMLHETVTFFNFFKVEMPMFFLHEKLCIFTPTVGTFRSCAGTDGAVCEQLLLDAPRELFVIVPRVRFKGWKIPW